MAQENITGRSDILPAHSRLSQKDIVSSKLPKLPEPVIDPHADIPTHASQLQRESDLNAAYVKRVESARRGLKRSIKFETNELIEQRDEALELSQTVDLTPSEQIHIVKNVSLQRGYVFGLESVGELINLRLQGEKPASERIQSKDQTEPNS